MRVFLLVLGVLLLLVVASMCVFTVDRSEFVYVTTFGRHTATYDGADGTIRRGRVSAGPPPFNRWNGSIGACSISICRRWNS